jgi:hypothetical protein
MLERKLPPFAQIGAPEAMEPRRMFPKEMEMSLRFAQTDQVINA